MPLFLAITASRRRSGMDFMINRAKKISHRPGKKKDMINVALTIRFVRKTRTASAIKEGSV